MSKKNCRRRNEFAASKTTYTAVTIVSVVVILLVAYSGISYLSSGSTHLAQSSIYSTFSGTTSKSNTTTFSVTSTSSASSTTISVTEANSSTASVNLTSMSSQELTSANTSNTSTSSAKAVDTGNSSEFNWLTYGGSTLRNGVANSTIGSIPENATVAWTANVDGSVFAEPLFFDGTTFTATENNTVYALNSSTGDVEWSNHLAAPEYALAPPMECNNNSAQAPDIRPYIGITGTPVIDASTGTLYAVALVSGTGFVLFALNTTTGAQNWNVTLNWSEFNYLPEEERGALALANGFVYVPFGGYSWDCVPPGPTGWVIAISITSHKPEYAFNVPTKIEADIWAPEGISVSSSGQVFLVTGDSDNTTFDLGNSVIKLSPELIFTNSTSNYFAASDWQYTNENDLDLGSTGATLLPGGLVFSIGKDGIGYLLNASNLGGIAGQLYNATVCGSYGAWGSTAYFNRTIFVPCGDGIHAISLRESNGSYYYSSLWNSSDYWAGPPLLCDGAVWSTNILGTELYALNPLNGTTMFQIQVGTPEHFTTPSAGGGLVYLAANQTVYGIRPVYGN